VIFTGYGRQGISGRLPHAAGKARRRVQVVTRPHNAPSALAGLPAERICGELQDLSSLICGCRESHHASRAR
jgi:hypothetical protein